MAFLGVFGFDWLTDLINRQLIVRNDNNNITDYTRIAA